MLPILSLAFEFIIFLLTVYFLFYIPSALLFSVSKIKLAYPTSIFLPIVSGVVGFTFTMYCLSWLHGQFLIYPLALVLLAIAWKKRIFKIPQIPSQHRIPTVVVIGLSLIFSLQMILNGNIGNSIYQFGDDMAHLGYISELKHAFPPQQPGFAGIPLRGYHFFADFFVAQVSNVTYISPLSLYFHMVPLLVALGWGFGAYTLLYLWTKKISAGVWGAFLLMFGSSFSFILPLLGKPNSVIFSNLGIDQPITSLLNAPFSFSFMLILGALVSILCYKKQKSITMLFLISFFVGISAIFKVYAGMILIAGYGVFTLFELRQKNFMVLASGLFAAALFAGTFGLFAGKGAGLFMLPLWPVERMFDAIFPEYNYKEKIETFTKLKVIKGLVITHVYTLTVFLLGNLGTRLFGIVFLVIVGAKKRLLPSSFSIILFTMSIVSITTPLFFAQTIKVFDMIQMAWYYPLLMALFAAYGLSCFLSMNMPRIIKITIIAIVVALTIPLTILSANAHIIPLLTVQRESMDNDYFKAMKYLKTHGTYEDTVLDLPLGSTYTSFLNVAHWYEGRSLDISAFGEKRMYVGNQYIVFPNMPLEQRLKFLVRINQVEFSVDRKQQEIDEVIKKLESEKISYVYSPGKLSSFDGRTDIKIVFQNPKAVIYKVE